MNVYQKVVIFLGFIACLLPGAFPVKAVSDTVDGLKANDADLQWFRDAKFGLFIHWGPVSLEGTEIGWSRAGERRFPHSTGTQIPVDVYDNLYKQFNPVEFNADEWISIAKAAGMKYLVFTTKHHDGFSMFDSQLTDYKITNTPFKRDVTAELANACHKAGIKLGFYHSPPDWHHPDYFTENHARYIQYLHGQVRELCSNYGKVDILWFDGLGGKPKDWDSYTLIPMVRHLQPGILINNRAGLPADFDTPEQRVGRFQNDRAWESCITICHQWAWKPDDQMKSLKECIDILARSVGGDGNLLFNVGPMPNGKIEDRQVKRLKEMGAWLDQYGETIYETRGGPFKPGPWGASTYKGKTIYLHILDWEESETLLLPQIDETIVSHRVLTGGEAAIEQTDRGIEVKIPADQRHPIDTIVALELEGPAAYIPPVDLPQYLSLGTGKTAKASNVFQNNNWAYGPAKAFDGDLSTRWATDSGTKQAWIYVDLENEVTFNRIVICESFGRTRQFELQYKKSGNWITFHKGNTIGNKLTVRVEPLTTRYVRLNVLHADDGPTFREIQFYLDQ